MSETLDKVAFDLGGNLAPLAASYAQADAMTDKLAASIKAKTGQSMFGTTEAMTAKLAAVFDKASNSSSKFFSETQAGSAKLLSARGALDEIEKATTSLHGSASVATREFRALFDELAGGRTRMVPGTLAIIATRVFGLSLASIAAAAVWAAPFIAAAAAAAVYIRALDEVQRKLAATGFASGVSRDQLVGMAENIASTPGSRQSVGGAQTGLGILAGRGNVGSDNLMGAEQAASGYAAATGEKLDKAASAFEEALAQPAKGARDLNEQMKLLSAGQVREIDDLVAAGDTEKAQEVIIKAMNDRTKEATSALSQMTQALIGFGKGLNDLINRAGKQLTGSYTDQDRLAALESSRMKYAPGQIQSANSSVAINNAGIDRLEAPLRAKLAAAQKQVDDGAKVAVETTLITSTLDEYKKKLNVAGTKHEEEAQATKAVADSLNAQKDILNRDLAKHADAGTIAGDRANLADLQTMATNAANPNYRWGSGVPKAPKGPKHPGIGSDEAVDNAVKDELTAQLELTRSITGRLAIQEQIAKIENAAKDAALKSSLIEQHITGAAAKRATDAEGSAAALKAQKDALDEQEALATQQNDSDKKLVGYKIEALKAAEQGKISESKRLSLELQALDLEQAQARKDLLNSQATNKNRLPDQDARDAAERAGLAGSQADVRSDVIRQSTDRSNDVPKQLQQSIDLLKQEGALKYADAEMRAKELADLEAIKEIKKENLDLTAADGQAQAAKLKALYEEQAAAQVENQGLSQTAQITDKLRSGFEDMATTAILHGKNLREVFHGIVDQIAEMILKMAVLNPLMNGLGGSGSTWGSGGLLGGLFKGLLGGGGAPAAAGGAPLLSMGGSGSAYASTGLLGGIFGASNSGSLISTITGPTTSNLSSGGLLGAMFGSTQSTSLLSSLSSGMGTTTASSNNSGASIFGSVLSGLLGGVFGGGKASGGYIDPARFYMVGENGPEILGPGVGGRITPITAPNVQNMSPQASGLVVMHHSFEINVSGNGDKELLQRMDQTANTAVARGIAVYDQTQNRTMRSRLITSNKRAFV